MRGGDGGVGDIECLPYFDGDDDDDGSIIPVITHRLSLGGRFNSTITRRRRV